MPVTSLSPAELPVRARRRITAPEGVDDLTWAPRDYDAFGRHFRDMTEAQMRKALPPDASDADVADAASEIMAKFIANKGLARYDANKLHYPPEGKTWRGGGREPRVAQFTGMYGSYLRLSARGMRDRYLRTRAHETRLPGAGEPGEVASTDASLEAATARQACREWLAVAESRLWRAGRGDLVAVLDDLRAALEADALDTVRVPADLAATLAAVGTDRAAAEQDLAS